MHCYSFTLILLQNSHIFTLTLLQNVPEKVQYNVHLVGLYPIRHSLLCKTHSII
jgi:hypothetical protein